MPAPGLDAIGAGASEAVVQEIARRVRAPRRAQRTQWGGSWSLERVFEMYDIGRRGAIGAAEFQAALNGIGLVLSGQELAPLLRRFDKLGNGTLVDYRDFCRFVEMDSSDLAFVTTAIAEKLDEQARQGLDVRMAFDLADPSGSGFVSAREFREALRQLSLPLTELQTQALISRFAQVGNPDLVSYDEFLKHAQAAAPTANEATTATATRTSTARATTAGAPSAAAGAAPTACGRTAARGTSARRRRSSGASLTTCTRRSRRTSRRRHRAI